MALLKVGVAKQLACGICVQLLAISLAVSLVQCAKLPAHFQRNGRSNDNFCLAIFLHIFALLGAIGIINPAGVQADWTHG